MNITKEFTKAFHKLKDKRMFIAFLSDIMFLFVYGFIVLPLLGKVVDYVTAIGYFISKSSGELTREYLERQSIFSALMSNPDVLFYFKRLVVLFLIIVIAVYFVYCLFHGISWKICYGKTKLNYLKQFFLINIFWVFVFVVQQIISLFFDLRMAMMQSVNPFYAGKTNFVPLLLLIVIVYFALLSYALIGKLSVKKALRKCFVIGVKKFKNVGLMYLFVIALFFVLNLVLFVAGKFSNILMVFLGIVLVIPAFSFVRVFVAGVVNSISKK